MPNHLQLLFLASFFFTFLVLLTLSNLLSSKLREAGYDLSNLILIGLPKSEHHTPNQMATSAPPFLDVRQSVVAQIIVLLLAAASSAFMYLKFGRTGTSSSLTWLPTSSSYSPLTV
jgi:cytochrome-b5 reductase